ncbi:MAG: hypothetical protein H0X08_07795 [Blastocatellia bacterium]|nr:hypothetical protein [Blastocatellia bacterium]
MQSIDLSGRVGCDRCVCGSIAPGITSLPAASMTFIGIDIDLFADQQDGPVLDQNVCL